MAARHCIVVRLAFWRYAAEQWRQLNHQLPPRRQPHIPHLVLHVLEALVPKLSVPPRLELCYRLVCVLHVYLLLRVGLGEAFAQKAEPFVAPIGSLDFFLVLLLVIRDIAARFL